MLEVGINSYCDLEFANEYFGGKLYSEKWDEANETTREKALKEACKRVDRIRFNGKKLKDEQPLQFPRVLGRVVGLSLQVSVGIPEEIKQAQCEEALALLERGNSPRTKAQEQGVVSLRIGEMAEEYDRKVRPSRLHSIEAWELLKGYVVGSVVIK